MPYKDFSFQCCKEEELDCFLIQELDKKGFLFSKKKIKALMNRGFIFVNRKKVLRLPYRLKDKDQVRLRFNPKQIEQKNLIVKFELRKTDILFEDEFLIAVNKPAGLPSQATLDPTRDHMYAATQRYLKNTYVGLHHRLDRDTSGVLLMTKKKSANAPIAKLFSQREIHKTYLCLCAKPLKEKWQRKSYLKKEKMKVIETKSGGDLAITDFETIASSNNLSLVQAKPKTGRMHQIRVHCQAEKIPILGDSLYGSIENDQRCVGRNIKRCMLHAYQLEFEHFQSREKIKIQANLPADFENLVHERWGDALQY